ncbi:MAG TPA: PD-(D/E)XK nuclease family protein, partial [Microbacteriaceae bacterium]|nr:PD-(D/E)XK nuclease family protein [Microbacteriaceae bacterium]
EAAVLRRLTEAGVPGADPGEWYGLREWSTTEPLEDLDADGARVRVSPSTIEKIEKSPLSWFVDQFAPAPPSDAQATGTIVHAALEHLGDRDEVTVNDFVAEVLPQLEALPLPADWMREQRERQVRTMLTRLCQYLESSRAKGRRFVAAEAPFRLEFGPVVLSGVIDRVERDTDGALYVVDLKTSKYPVSKQDAAVSAQLECYQLAIHEGAIEGVESAPSAGAALLYVRSATQTPTLRTQDPLGSERAEEVRARVLAAAERMSDAAFADFDDIDENGIAGARRYRIQVVPGVSA